MVEHTTTERWFDILGKLQTPEALAVLASSSAPTKRHVPQRILQKVLSLAINSVQHDDQWNISGIPELLVRAREMADVGILSAWRMAVSLLDFHKMVVRVQVAAKCQDSLLTTSVDDASSSGSDTSGESGSATAALTSSGSGSLKRSRPADDTSDTSSSDKDSEFAWPDAPSPLAASQRLHGGSSGGGEAGSHSFAKPALPSTPRPVHTAGARASQADKQAAAPQPGVWSNALCYHHHGRTAVLANLDVPLPISLPNRPLHVSAVVPRSAVKMGKHRACRTSFKRATPAQVARLQSLAVNELVVVAPLSGDAVPLQGSAAAAAPLHRLAGGASPQEGSMVLVPYLDDAQALRCVTFLLNTSPAVAAAAASSPPAKRVAR